MSKLRSPGSLAQKRNGGSNTAGRAVPGHLPRDGAGRYSGRRALVVEHDADARTHYRALLEDRGFEVASVDCGVAALRAARRDPPDLILMDLQLSDVSGLEAAGWLKADPALSAIPVIAITAMALPKDDRRLQRSAIDVLLPKPLSIARLEQTIRALLP